VANQAGQVSQPLLPHGVSWRTRDGQPATAVTLRGNLNQEKSIRQRTKGTLWPLDQRYSRRRSNYVVEANRLKFFNGVEPVEVQVVQVADRLSRR
jgi:hypothetical protein